MAEIPPVHGKLLLVDDDPVLRQVLVRALTRRGFQVVVADSTTTCLERLDQETLPDFALLDLNLGGSSGLRLIPSILQRNPECEIVVLTGYASIPTAVDAVKLGARQYLAKPVDAETIVKAFLEDQAPNADEPPEETLSVSRLEWEHIQRVLAEHGGNISATARALKMHRRTLQRKLLKRPAKG